MGKLFFECNLPKTAPSHLLPGCRAEFEAVTERIRHRHELLQSAYDLLTDPLEGFRHYDMKPETFQKLMATHFANCAEAGRTYVFDGSTPTELAEYAERCFITEEPETRLDFPNAIVLFDTKFATNEEWVELRHIGIGGSDAAVICGTSKYKTPRALYHNKIGTELKLNPDADKEGIFQRGHLLEDTVINKYCKDMEAVRITDTRMFQSRTHPHCIADIDGILRLKTGELIVFEAKTTVLENRDSWRGGKIPATYIQQCRHYPSVLSDDRIIKTVIGCLFTLDITLGGDYIASNFDGNTLLFRDVPRDKADETDLMDTVEDFWSTYIEAHNEPEESRDFEKDKKELDSRVGPADPSLPPLELGTLFKDDCEEYLRLEEARKKLKGKMEAVEAEQDSIKLKFIAELGACSEGRVDWKNDRYIEIKYSPRSAAKKVDMEKLLAEYPEAYEKCIVPPAEPTRYFTLKEKIIKKK